MVDPYAPCYRFGVESGQTVISQFCQSISNKSCPQHFPRGLLAGGHNPASELSIRVDMHCYPTHVRQVWGQCFDLRGFDAGSLTYTFPPCLPDPDRLAVPVRPVVIRAAPALPRASEARLPVASFGCCDSPTAEPFHLRSDSMAPRGARGR